MLLWLYEGVTNGDLGMVTATCSCQRRQRTRKRLESNLSEPFGSGPGGPGSSLQTPEPPDQPLLLSSHCRKHVYGI